MESETITFLNISTLIINIINTIPKMVLLFNNSTVLIRNNNIIALQIYVNNFSNEMLTF